MTTAVEQNQDIRAVYLAAEDIKVAASLLFQAYHEDPLFKSIFQAEKDGYDVRLRAAIREELLAFWQAKETIIGLFEDERLVAVTAVISPDSGFGPSRFWNWRLRMSLTAGFFSTNKMIEKEQIIQDAIPVKNYHMISFIGVQPGEQHHGLGHILMNAIDTIMIEHPDSEGVGVLATRKTNVSFFEHGNYKKIKELQIGDITGELMFRSRP